MLYEVITSLNLLSPYTGDNFWTLAADINQGYFINHSVTNSQAAWPARVGKTIVVVSSFHNTLSAAKHFASYNFV